MGRRDFWEEYDRATGPSEPARAVLDDLLRRYGDGPDDVVVTYDEIAASLGVERDVVRDAMRELFDFGLVTPAFDPTLRRRVYKPRRWRVH